jgi:hypothetical protein
VYAYEVRGAVFVAAVAMWASRLANVSAPLGAKRSAKPVRSVGRVITLGEPMLARATERGVADTVAPACGAALNE